MNVYSVEDDYMHDVYTDVLLDVYCEEIRYLIFDHLESHATGHGGRGLIHQECFGCIHNSPFLNDHDFCIIPFEQQIEYLIEDAIYKLDEEKITHKFQEAISTSDLLSPLSAISPRQHLLDPVWRQQSWLSLIQVRLQVHANLVCMEQYRRNINTQVAIPDLTYHSL